MKRFFMGRAIALIILVLIVAGYFMFRNNRSVKAPTESQSAERPTPTQPALTHYHVGGWHFDFDYPTDTYKLNTQGSQYTNLDNQVVQVTTDKTRFPKTNFNDADFTVGAAVVNSEQKCLTMNLPASSEGFKKSVVIGGVKYYEMDSTDAAAGNIYQSKSYRTYDKNGACLEMVETIHTGNIHNYPVGTVTEVDAVPIWAELDQIFRSIKLNVQ